MYELFLRDPGLVERRWADFFKTVPLNGKAKSENLDIEALKIGVNFGAESSTSLTVATKLAQLIQAYRDWGHVKARVNPLTKGIIQPKIPSNLSIEALGLTDAQLRMKVPCLKLGGAEILEVEEIIRRLEEIYCSSIGFEYSHLSNYEEREWLRERIETRNIQPTPVQRKERLQRLIDTEEFENNLFKTYIGQKWFSIRGAETLIPLLDSLLNKAVECGAKESVIGMAHRGRLAVLSFIAGKPLANILDEFDDLTSYAVVGSGDTKYHKGSHGTFASSDGQELQISLAYNPSHLEAVNPIVEGWARAIQDLAYERSRQAVLPILMHGEAAFSGQGVVSETLNFSNVAGYSTGGSIHILVNNQIGFTTTGDEGRSSCYSSDFAKAVEAPIFHVNYEDVDACCWVAEIATEFRHKFSKDVLIDLVCFRRFGHNEADEPSITQPLMYSEITKRDTVATQYAQRLQNAGVISDETAHDLRAAYGKIFASIVARPKRRLAEATAIHGRLNIEVKKTAVSNERLLAVAEVLTKFPQDFELHPKLKQLIEKRITSIKTGKGIDWGSAEALAFGSLLQDGVPVRLSGQDCGRGTFSHRQLLYADTLTAQRYFPLSQLNISPLNNVNARCEIFNSTLSENAVLGFEFGYSSYSSKPLVLWEAQFGDFVNGAQIVIDQFIAASEAKWDQLSGVVLLLPHGYEGMGSEHSSARLERFLQLAAENNICVAYPSTAAQYFHLLRRQGLSEIKRPLVVMTPKSLLRLPEAAASSNELTKGSFRKLIATQHGKGKHLVFCAGKIFHEFQALLKSAKNPDLSLVRIEQLYPFPETEVNEVLRSQKYSSFSWLQEEPRNMGAYSFMFDKLFNLGVKLDYFGRPEGASPATGSLRRHQAEQKLFLDQILSRIS